MLEIGGSKSAIFKLWYLNISCYESVRRREPGVTNTEETDRPAPAAVHTTGDLDFVTFVYQ